MAMDPISLIGTGMNIMGAAFQAEGALLHKKPIYKSSLQWNTNNNNLDSYIGTPKNQPEVVGTYKEFPNKFSNFMTGLGKVYSTAGSVISGAGFKLPEKDGQLKSIGSSLQSGLRQSSEIGSIGSSLTKGLNGELEPTLNNLGTGFEKGINNEIKNLDILTSNNKYTLPTNSNLISGQFSNWQNNMIIGAKSGFGVMDDYKQFKY